MVHAVSTIGERQFIHRTRVPKSMRPGRTCAERRVPRKAACDEKGTLLVVRLMLQAYLTFLFFDIAGFRQIVYSISIDSII